MKEKNVDSGDTFAEDHWLRRRVREGEKERPHPRLHYRLQSKDETSRIAASRRISLHSRLSSTQAGLGHNLRREKNIQELERKFDKDMEPAPLLIRNKVA